MIRYVNEIGSASTGTSLSGSVSVEHFEMKTRHLHGAIQLGTRCQPLGHTPFVGTVFLPQLKESCLVVQVRHSVFVVRQAEKLDTSCASPCSTDTRRYSVSWQYLARSLMRLCQPSTSLLVRTAFPNTDQALGGHEGLSSEVTRTYWKRLRRTGYVAL